MLRSELLLDWSMRSFNFNSKETDLRSAIIEKDFTTIENIITCDNVNQQFVGGWTWITYACAINNPEFMEWLITSRKANFRNPNKYGSPPFIQALGYPRCALVLLKHGVRPDEVAVGERTLLYQIIIRYLSLRSPMQSLIETAWHLLEYGAKVPKKVLIPQVIQNMQIGRQATRTASVVFLGIQRYHKSLVFRGNNKDVARMIGKFIWEGRICYKPAWTNIE